MPDFNGLNVAAAHRTLAAALRDAGFETAGLDGRLLKTIVRIQSREAKRGENITSTSRLNKMVDTTMI